MAKKKKELVATMMFMIPGVEYTIPNILHIVCLNSSLSIDTCISILHRKKKLRLIEVNLAKVTQL
jgi:hypothetical protein